MEDDSGPLQSAWAREVQRRHMARTARQNGTRAMVPATRPGHRIRDWAPHNTALRLSQPRFADFSRYGFGLQAVPVAVVDDLRLFMESVDHQGGLPKVDKVGDSEFRRIPEKKASDVTDAECAICLKDAEPMEKLKVLPCGHAFHGLCLRRWLHRSRTCPTCRTALAPDAAHTGSSLRGQRRPSFNGSSTAAPPTRACAPNHASNGGRTASEQQSSYRRPRPPSAPWPPSVQRPPSSSQPTGSDATSGASLTSGVALGVRGSRTTHGGHPHPHPHPPSCASARALSRLSSQRGEASSRPASVRGASSPELGSTMDGGVVIAHHTTAPSKSAGREANCQPRRCHGRCHGRFHGRCVSVSQAEWK